MFAAAIPALLAALGTPAFAAGPWVSPWALPAPSESAERERSCAAYRTTMQIVDTLRARPKMWARAEALSHETRLRAERVFGADSEEASMAMFFEAEVPAREIGHASPATLALLAKVLDWRQRHRGPTHSSLIEVLSLQAKLHSLALQPAEMRAAGLRAVAIAEAQTPPDSSMLARMLVNLSIQSLRVGDSRGALPLAQRAVEIQRRTGASPALLASALMSLGDVYIELGRAREAEPTCEEAYRIRRGLFEPEDFWLGLAAGALGMVRAQLGDVESALPLFEQSLRAQIRFVGPHFAGVGETLCNIAALHMRMCRYEQAERTYRDALGVFTASVELTYTDALAALEGLGRALTAQARWSGADSAFTEVLRRVPPDPTQPMPLAVPKALVGHAQLLAARGEHASARTALELADSLFIAKTGRDHVSRVRALTALAELETDAGGTEAALSAVREACRIELAHQVYTLRALPEEDILRFREAPSQALDAAVRLAKHAPDDTALVASIWDEVAAARGLGRRELMHRLDLRVPQGDSVGLELEKRFRSAAWRTDRLISGASGSAGTDAVTAAVREAESAGRQLARHLASHSGPEPRPRPSAREVRHALAPGAALVAFQRVEPAETSPGQAHYVAFVQPPRGRPPRLVRLGVANEIDDDLLAWRAAVERSASSAEQARLAARLGRRLFARVWEPVAAAIGSMGRTHVVADGELQTLAPGAWRMSGDPREWPVLSMIEHESDLVHAPPVAARSDTLLVVGGVDYGGSLPPQAVVVRSSAGDSVSAGFEPLPASIAEIRAAASAWRASGGRVRELRAGVATTLAFRDVAPRAQALHIASHTWALSSRAHRTADPGPLRRVGIAFAGANLSDTSVTGVLTAAEIARLDLSDVRLVIVSACRSALGRPITGEGLLGLRSAFAIAGAQRVVASLWNVGDESTAYWMEHFYAALAVNTGDVALAARDASLATREWSRSRRTGPESAYAWGGFVVSGPP